MRRSLCSCHDRDPKCELRPQRRFRTSEISIVPAFDSSHALSKLCTLACSRGLTVTSDSQYTSPPNHLKNLTETVHAVSNSMTVSRDRTPDRGPDGDRGSTREQILQLWRETRHTISLRFGLRVSSNVTVITSASAYSIQQPALSSPMLRVTHNHNACTRITDRPSLICLQGLLASALSKTIRTNIRVHAPCPCTCNGTRA
jgi:hypothetical protein